MKLPKWRPDAPDYDDGTITGLVTCRNVYPSAGGYRPIADLSAATGALPEDWSGGGAFEFNGNSVFLGATDTALYAHASGAWVSKHTLATSLPWHFAQFGDFAIGVNGADVIKFEISTGTGSALGGSPPDACQYIAIVQHFVVMAGDADNSMRVYWSGLEDPEGWTVGTNQCDVQDFPEDGPITGLSGGEYMVVFQNAAITIGEYVGTPDIFHFRKVESSVGCIAHGSIVQHERMHFFLARDGFKAWSPEIGVKHIGENAVDETFFARFGLSEIAKIRSAIDPERRLVIWQMPDTLFMYHIETDSWAEVSISGLVGMSAGTSAASALTLEEIGGLFATLEDVTPGFDDPQWGASGGGVPLLHLFKSDGIGYTSSAGTTLEATLQAQKFEPHNGYVSHVINSAFTTDATDGVTLHLDCSPRPGDSQTRVSSANIRNNGDIPIRASGRVIQPTWVISTDATWSYAKGFEFDARKGGRL